MMLPIANYNYTTSLPKSQSANTLFLRLFGDSEFRYIIGFEHYGVNYERLAVFGEPLIFDYSTICTICISIHVHAHQ